MNSPPIKKLLSEISQDRDTEKISRLKLQAKLEISEHKIQNLNNEIINLTEISNKQNLKISELENNGLKYKNKFNIESKKVASLRNLQRSLTDDFEVQARVDLNDLKNREELAQQRVKTLEMKFFDSEKQLSKSEKIFKSLEAKNAKFQKNFITERKNNIELTNKNQALTSENDLLHKEIKILKNWKDDSITKMTEFKNTLQKIKYLKLQKSLLEEKLDFAEEQKGDVLKELGKTQKDKKIVEMENFGLKSENESFRVMASRSQTPASGRTTARSVYLNTDRSRCEETTVNLQIENNSEKKRPKKRNKTSSLASTSSSTSISQSMMTTVSACSSSCTLTSQVDGSQLKNAWS